MSLWKLMKPGTQSPVGFVRGTQAEAAAAAQRVANQSGQSLSLSRQITPQVGQVWHGLTGDRCRIVAVSGKRVTVLQLDSGQRVTSDLADFLAGYRPPRVMARANPKRGGPLERRYRSEKTFRAALAKFTASGELVDWFGDDHGWVIRLRRLANPKVKGRNPRKVRADSLQVGDIVMPPTRELQLWMKRTAKERGMSPDDLGIMLTEVREGAPDKGGRWLIFKGYLRDAWYAGGKQYPTSFKARPETPWSLVATPTQDNPARSKTARAKRTRLLAGTSRKASRAAASGQFTKAGYYSRRSAYRRGRSAARGGSVPAWENGHQANRRGLKSASRSKSGRFRRASSRGRSVRARSGHRPNPGAEARRQLEALLKRARTLWESGRKAEAQKLYERAWEFATPHGNPKRHMKGRINPRSPREGAVAMAEMWNDSPDYQPRVGSVKVPPRPKALAKLGDVVSLVYRSSKYAGTPSNPKGKAQLHEHRTSRPHPVLAADPDGHLHLVGGRMRPTADGLVN